MTEEVTLHDLLMLSDEVFTFIKSMHTNQLRGIPGLWEIQTSRQNARSRLEAALPEIADSELHRLFQTLAAREQRLYEIDKKLLAIVADFLGVPVPQSEVEFQQLQEEIKKHVRTHRESRWLLTLPYERLLKKAHNLYLRVEDVDMGIFLRVKQITTPNVSDEPGSSDYVPPSKAKVIRREEKLKREIQSASDDFDIERGISKLHRILERQKPAASDVAWVYEELAGKYWASGDLQQAINYITKAIESGESGQPLGLLYFWRGQLYYQQQQWEKAKNDLKVALAEGVSLPEEEEAKQYLAEIEKQIT